MKPNYTLLLLATGLTLTGPAWAQQPSPQAAQEIQALRQRIADLEKLKERLDRLERQIAAQKAAAAQKPADTTKPAAPKPAAPAVKLSGYVQARFETNITPKGQSDFSIRRARVKVQGDPTPWSSVVYQVEAAGANVTTLDAYADLRPKSLPFLRAGQFKVPFGLEVAENPADRLAPEASKAVSTLFGTLRDRGFMLGHEIKANQPGVSVFLAALNGNGSNARDNNGTKDVALRVVRPFTWGALGASYYTGRFTRGVTTKDATGASITTDVTTSKERYGAEALVSLGRAEVRSEYIAGHDLGASVSGGYAQAAYTLKKPTGTPFVKYDWYDKNRNAGGDWYSRWSLGYAHQLGANTRLTLAEQIIHDSATPKGDNVTTVQVQVKF
ncbi:MAG TPA: porin [Armatimonadota bacterium]